MTYKEIRALSRKDAQDILRSHCVWRVPRGGQMKHLFIRLGVEAPGTTLCGKEMWPYSAREWRQITTKRHCARCTHALSLLRIQAGEAAD